MTRLVYVSHLTLHDFRSYESADVALDPGVTAFVGRNGQGKTNLVEAIDYLSRLTSHRVATDAPLVRAGSERAVVRAAVVKDGRTAVLEVEINPGRANRARVNKSVLPRTRDLVGLVRTVLFSPEDLALVKGDPSERRRFLDDLLVLRTPRLAGLRADYDRVLKQRNSLLKSMVAARRGRRDDEFAASTLVVWDEQLAQHGAELLAARVEAGRRPQALRRQGLRGGGPRRLSRGRRARVQRRPSRSTDDLGASFLATLADRRKDELDRGLSLVGPHRDDLLLTLAPAGTVDGRRATSSRSRATPATASRGRSRWRSAWRRTTCCGPTATTRSSSWTTCSRSSTPSAGRSSRSWSPAPSRSWSPRPCRPTCPTCCPGPGSWSPAAR